MKPSRIFQLSRISSIFHFLELAPLLISATSPPGGERDSLFHINSNLKLKRWCSFNGLNEVEQHGSGNVCLLVGYR
jgi:hypothetical protein